MSSDTVVLHDTMPNKKQRTRITKANNSSIEELWRIVDPELLSERNLQLINTTRPETSEKSRDNVMSLGIACILSKRINDATAFAFLNCGDDEIMYQLYRKNDDGDIYLAFEMKSPTGSTPNKLSWDGYQPKNEYEHTDTWNLRSNLIKELRQFAEMISIELTGKIILTDKTKQTKDYVVFCPFITGNLRDEWEKYNAWQKSDFESYASFAMDDIMGWCVKMSPNFSWTHVIQKSRSGYPSYFVSSKEQQVLELIGRAASSDLFNSVRMMLNI